MQQQHRRETSVLHGMSVALDMTNAKLGHLDKALEERSSLLATTTATSKGWWGRSKGWWGRSKGWWGRSKGWWGRSKGWWGWAASPWVGC